MAAVRNAFSYPLHYGNQYQPVPLEGVPQIPETVARKLTYYNDLDEADQQACDAAIVRATAELRRRHAEKKRRAVYAGHWPEEKDQ